MFQLISNICEDALDFIGDTVSDTFDTVESFFDDEETASARNAGNQAIWNAREEVGIAKNKKREAMEILEVKHEEERESLRVKQAKETTELGVMTDKVVAMSRAKLALAYEDKSDALAGVRRRVRRASLEAV